MSNLKQNKNVTDSSDRQLNQNSVSPAGSTEPAWMQRLRRFILEEDYAGAKKMLRETGEGPDARNALGVCLMRSGKAQEAIEVLKALVIEPGTLVERSDIPEHYRRNFATALLMCQRIGGCLQLLRPGKNDKHPVSEQLLQTIKDWEKSLSFWQKVNWKLYEVIPDNRPIQLAFVPGEFTSTPQSQLDE
jgi:hypothetical protein